MMLIDEFVPKTNQGSETKRLSLTARRFLFDDAMASHLAYLFNGQEVEHLLDQRPFAVPPFDLLYLEIAGKFPMGYLWTPARQLALLIRNRENAVFQIPIVYDWDTETFNPFDDATHDMIAGDEDFADHASKAFGRFVGAMLVLNAPPKVRQITDVPRKAKIVKGKRKVYQAHHVVTINLAESEKFVRGFYTNARGPYRAHEVRGHWMHVPTIAPHSGGCDWFEIEPSDAAPDKPRFRCSICNRLRTYRPWHQRGDAGIGYVTKEYHVTHKPRRLPSISTFESLYT